MQSDIRAAEEIWPAIQIGALGNSVETKFAHAKSTVQRISAGAGGYKVEKRIFGRPEMGFGKRYCLAQRAGLASGHIDFSFHSVRTRSPGLPLERLLLYMGGDGMVRVVVEFGLHQEARTRKLGGNLDISNDRIVHDEELDVVINSRCPAILLKIGALRYVFGQYTRVCSN